MSGVDILNNNIFLLNHLDILRKLGFRARNSNKFKFYNEYYYVLIGFVVKLIHFLKLDFIYLVLKNYTIFNNLFFNVLKNKIKYIIIDDGYSFCNIKLKKKRRIKKNLKKKITKILNY